MISIKRDSLGNLQKASGMRKQKSSMYIPGQTKPFKVSRSKFSDFLNCKRCFYLDRVRGLSQPKLPGWSLNVAVDENKKKEFDYYREKKQPHPIMIKNKLNFVPFFHDDLDKWRNSLSGGISYYDKKTNLIIQGGVDDIWYNTITKEIIVVDYKAQSQNGKITSFEYLNSPFHIGYKQQMDIYVFILKKMGFLVSDKTYFYVCNANKNLEQFDSKLNFDTYLIEYKSNINWIEDKILEMKNTLDNDTPDINESCENCAYINQANLLAKKPMSLF